MRARRILMAPTVVRTPRAGGRDIAAHADSSQPVLAVTMGDPAGIGPEVVAKALAHPDVPKVGRVIVIGSLPVMERTVRALGVDVAVVPVAGHEAPRRRRVVPVLDPLEQPWREVRPGTVSTEAGAAAVRFILKAVQLARTGCVDAIVTGPIHKRAMHLAGYAYPGHTELLASVTKSRAVGMMIVGGPLKVMFATTHVALRDLPGRLSPPLVLKTIRLAHQGLHDYFGVRRPRIGVAALNPHASDGGLFGDEERLILQPACRRARRLGIDATDPLPADTLFGRAVRGEFDAVVAQYHDQGLIPLKTVAFGHCVNVTVGLPIVRTSVDHGTAFDIVGKGVADPGSLIEAIRLAADVAARKKGVR